eukprot:TRINITY_DN3958_c0_g1_i1.p1 TRINITY_DN3958_c0_g1~~TRINITY_DN3958_c0_g1_i1.p1  ORF type:complete len:118 (-),score=8.77 TRINITY_DN3958_c0_g1_i1:29-382(-)
MHQQSDRNNNILVEKVGNNERKLQSRGVISTHAEEPTRFRSPRAHEGQGITLLPFTIHYIPVSYTHLTLPTILLVQISVVAVSLKKKKQKIKMKMQVQIEKTKNTNWNKLQQKSTRS